MGDLSENFSTWEFKCPCCNIIQIDIQLIQSLQELRESTGRSIRINSGYRCKKYNRKIGGAQNSLHLSGKAADIVIAKMNLEDMYIFACAVEHFYKGGIGIYTEEFIHVDVRNYKARWGRIDGRRSTATAALAAWRKRNGRK